MGIGTEERVKDAVPIPAPGIGTRISAACDAIGTRKYAASVIGVSVDSLARYIRGENMPPFDVAARLCVAAGLSMEWLATAKDSVKPLGEKGFEVPDEGVYHQSQAVSDENLTIALELADKALGGGYLPRPRYARLVRLLYEGITQGLPVADVLQFGERAGRALAKGDEVDGGESEVGRTGRTAAR